MKRDIGSWKMSVRNFSHGIQLKMAEGTEFMKRVRPNRDFSDSFS